MSSASRQEQTGGLNRFGGDSKMEIQRTIKYDADRVKGFGREIMSVPGCEPL
jgi:hypothetical protein